jgi:hypothetical protein
MASKSEALSIAERSRMALNLNASAFKYLSAVPAFALDHAPDPWAWMMLAGVIFDRQDFQIFGSIVVLDTVSVVDVLSAAEASAKQSSHDFTVLKLESVANTHRDVSIRADKAACVLDLSAALHGAEAHAASCSLGLNPKISAATFAGNNDHS